MIGKFVKFLLNTFEPDELVAMPVIIFAVAVLAVLLLCRPAKAAEMDIYEQALSEELSRSPLMRPLPNYFNPIPVPLTKEEEAALNMAKEWAKTPSKPIRLSNGKIAFLYGASIPTIIASPFNIVDIEFQPDESIQSVLLGDTARWNVESAAVGSIPHVFIKPLDTGLDTTAIITSSKRVYHLRLVSRKDDFMPYVGFIYRENSMAMIRQAAEAAQKQETFSTAVIADRIVSLTELDFNYKVDGKAKWKPVQVYSDNEKTYIRLPEMLQELPVLMAKSQDNILVNYRIENRVFIVDGIFPELLLVLGTGSKQEKVTIKRL
ncbi:MAG: P-type conjugative transfer protein TrbG [Deltaproteobacteria bacterium]|jgi:type IV secretion system protein VirB9|nr:P-type conjugative transfer protein TrbG [Deltaproteobacteria bacterium]